MKREHDGGETPPSQPPGRRRSIRRRFAAGVPMDRWRLAGWQCAVSAHCAGGWRERVVLAALGRLVGVSEGSRVT